MTGQIVRADGIVLGEEKGEAVGVHLQDADLRRHVLIVDPSGVGSRELLAQALSQQIERGGAIIVFDGDLIPLFSTRSQALAESILVSRICWS